MKDNKATMKGRGPKALMLVVVLLIMSFSAIVIAEAESDDATNEDVELSTSKITLKPTNDSAQLTATITLGDSGGTKTIKWSSSNTSVATVTSTEEVTATTSASTVITPHNTLGSAVITITFKVVTASATITKTDTCTVYVQNSITSVSIVDKSTDTPFTNKKLDLNTNDTKELKALINPSNGTVASTTWESNHSEYVEVSTSGVIKAKAPGEASIKLTVTMPNGTSKTDALTVKVTNIDVTGVTLDKSSVTLKIREVSYIIATIEPPNATIKTVSISMDHTGYLTAEQVSDPSLAANKIKIKLTGVAEGNAIITVTTTEKAKTATCAVKVERVPVTGVTLTETTLEMENDDTHRLTAVVAPEDATNTEVTWSSSNTSVATVDSNGNITPVSPGNSTITVTTKEGSFTATCALTVTRDLTITPTVTKSSGVATVDNVSSVKDKIEKVKTDGYYPILYVSATDCDKIVVSSDIIKSLKSATKATLFLETRIGSFQVSDSSLKSLKTDKSTFAVSMKAASLSEKYDAYKPFYAYEVDVYSGEDKVSASFGGGHAVIILPHTLTTGESAEKLAVAYIPNNAKPVLVEKSEYDSTNKEIIFFTNHCSTFMVLFHDNDIKPEGNNTIVFIVFLIIVIVLIVLITLFIKSPNGFKGMFNFGKGNNRRQQPPQPPRGYYPSNDQYNGNNYYYRR